MLPILAPRLKKHSSTFSCTLLTGCAILRGLSLGRFAAAKTGPGSGPDGSQDSHLAKNLLHELEKKQSYPPTNAHALFRQVKKRSKQQKHASKAEPASVVPAAAAPSGALAHNKASTSVVTVASASSTTGAGALPSLHVLPPDVPSPIAPDGIGEAPSEGLVSPRSRTGSFKSKSSVAGKSDREVDGVAADLLKELQKDKEYPPTFIAKRSRGLAVDGRVYQLLQQSRIVAKSKNTIGSRPEEQATVATVETQPTDNRADVVSVPSPLSEAPALEGANIQEATGLLKVLMEKSTAGSGGESVRDTHERADISTLMKSMKQRSITSQKRVPKKSPHQQRLSLTDGPTLSLFTGVNFDLPSKSISEFLSKHEKQWHADMLALLPASEPQNAFEEQMLTIDKQWKFPINNEDAMLCEDGVSFEDHVFLDHLLDNFPEEGLVRKFMELVITGLQQNPYLTVEKKHERIMWYKTYFEKFPQADLVGVP